MIKKDVLTMFKAVAGLLVLLLFSMQGYARIIHNGSEAAFHEPDQPVITEQVITAAGYFLKSQSELLQLLEKIELSDLTGADYTELQLFIDSTVVNMKDAETAYITLAQTADGAGYNPEPLTTLANFDYASFRETKNLNISIFQQVETYLAAGDIRGVYHKMVTDTGRLLEMLNRIKTAVAAGTLPQMEDLWTVNEAFAEILLFGQYSARIFYEITGK